MQEVNLIHAFNDILEAVKQGIIAAAAAKDYDREALLEVVYSETLAIRNKLVKAL